MATSKPRKKRPDWEAIERDFRLTQLSAAELSRRYNDTVTPQGINKRARERGWQRDLGPVLRSTTRALVNKEEARRRVVSRNEITDVTHTMVEAVVSADVVPTETATPVSAERKPKVSRPETKATAVASQLMVAAEIGAGVIMRHRGTLNRLTTLIDGLLEELESVVISREDLAALFAILHTDASELELMAARRKFQDLMSMPGRISSLQKLVDAVAKAQVSERKAHNLDEDEGKGKSGDELWLAIKDDRG